MIIKKIFILFGGYTGDDKGDPIAAFKTKKAARDFVRKEFPEARGAERTSPSELYWQWEGGGQNGRGGWLRAYDEGITLHQ